VVDCILDKGLVLDAWVRVAPPGLELLTIEARFTKALPPSKSKEENNTKESQVMENYSVYIYGIIEEPAYKSFVFRGIGSNEVYTVNYHKLAAVVSKLFQEDVYPTRKNILVHTMVQEAILLNYAILPMSFGIVAPNAGEVKKFLENNYLSLQQELNRLAGKIELELKAFWNKETVNQELAENQGYLSIKYRLKNASSLLEKQNLIVKVGKLVESVVLQWQEKINQEVYPSLKSLAVDTYLNKLSGITNILNASFLVEKDKENEFRERVYQFEVLYKDKINFKYIAPLPPYNFIRIKLNKTNIFCPNCGNKVEKKAASQSKKTIPKIGRP